MSHTRTGTRRCASRTRSAGGTGGRRKTAAVRADAETDQLSELPARSEGVAMTRLDAIRTLLGHVRRQDPEMFRQLMCELLGGLGFADVNAAFDYLLERETSPHFPIL